MGPDSIEADANGSLRRFRPMSLSIAKRLCRYFQESSLPYLLKHSDFFSSLSL